ncbi:MAG: hypothetical protein V4670_12020 [Bacteroidota bacterium]
MILQFRIFHDIKPNGRNLTLSEKLSQYSLITAFVFSLILLGVEKLFEIKAYPFLMWIPIIGFFIHLTSMFVRINEYENLNGYFDGTLILNEEFIVLNNLNIPLNEIEKLEINYFDFSGRKTGNYRYGPMYTNGIGNQIKIKTRHSSYECYFEIISETLIYNIEQYLYNIVVNRKLPSTKNHLDLVPNDLKDNKAFIAISNEVKN